LGLTCDCVVLEVATLALVILATRRIKRPQLARSDTVVIVYVFSVLVIATKQKRRRQLRTRRSRVTWVLYAQIAQEWQLKIATFCYDIPSKG
jgi:hypothetical protein